jgi:hypothetical protein
MATIVKTPSGTWKAMVRLQGWPTTIKTFRLKQDARDWARNTEDEMVQGVYHPGIYLSRFPGLQHLDLRLEGATTDSSAAGARQANGQFFYWEEIQRQGPTSEGFLMGDPIGRTGKGGQAWMTWHLSPKDYVGASYRRAKSSPQFLRGGTTQNEYAFTVRKWFAKRFQVEGLVQYENWKVPLYMSGSHSDTMTSVKFTWYPPRRD